MKNDDFIDAEIVGEPKPEPVIEPKASCRVTLKGGEVIDLDISATRLKHIKRSGGYIPARGPNGNGVIIPSKFIKKIVALAPTES